MGPLGPWALRAVFARSFLIQGSWNYHTMLGSGFAFAMLPALRRLFAEDREAFDAAVRRHLEHFNAHPYLTTMALGAALRLEADGASPETVRRFKAAVRGPLGSLGDALVWASWLPAVSLAALSLIWLGAPGWLAVATFLVVYNIGHVGLRVWGFRTGWTEGRDVGRRLAERSLGQLSGRIRAGAALLLGVLSGAILAAEDGLGSSGLAWVALGAIAFIGGARLGQRAWRPAAAAVVAAVVGLAIWGVTR